ncbi:HAMP domain-containing methyl-accepting chemotaxis protein [Metabacillus fastidiosus]|uniref:methyl-accepting chemotaxis protein n=1 Tax=Metabacillus fastidiosus TaxID=1458 RepID=UPI002E1A3523|nr:HAMP domain-containing methyl-accepting chemotaxis protein [Metabacillus fastidiosus]
MKISKLIKILMTVMISLSIISVISLALLYTAIKERTETINIQIKAESLADDFLLASDALSDNIRAYVQYGEIKYYNAYMKEINETKTRENVISELKKIQVSNEVIGLLEQAFADSHKLAEIEKEAFAFAEKKDYENARRIVFGDQYNIQKDFISDSLTKFDNKMNEWADEQSHITYTKMNTFLISTIVIIITLVIFINLALIVLLRKIKPLQQLTAMAERVSDGDLTTPALRFKDSKDEVSHLTKAFNKMINNLTTLVKKVKETSEQVAASSEELASSSEQNSYATEEIATTIQSLAAGAEKQASAVNGTSEIIQQISASSQQIAASTEITLTMINEASEKTDDGNEAIQTSVKQMGLITKNVNELEYVIKDMGEHSKKIGQIVEAITGIANQTNLLALNAAIEAARAGESGRGFAVVADEVRKLAELSAESAKQISGLIHVIQTDTNKAVVSMESTAKEVNSGMKLINTAGASFNQINEAISEVTKQIEEVSSAVEQMASGTEQVVQSVELVKTVANEAASSSQTISASSEEQLASSEEITASASSLSQMADDLQLQIETFKL